LIPFKIIFLIICLSVSFFITLKTIDLLIKYGEKFGIVDHPDIRKKEFVPKVRVGGLALVTGYIYFLLVAYFFLIDKNHEVSPLINISIICSLVIYLIGLIEDIFKISPFIRLFLHFLVATIAFNNGLFVSFDIFGNSFDPYFLKILSYLFTCFWLVAGINAMNWMDGLDGLASGISSILFMSLSAICFLKGLLPLAIISVALGLSAFIFTLKNFYPAKILMGDGGSYFLGFKLAAVSIMLLNAIAPETSGINSIFKYYSPLLILILPYFDMIRVVLFRLSRGSTPFLPDRSHIHYKILDSGIKHKNVVIYLYFICVLTIIPNLIFILI